MAFGAGLSSSAKSLYKKATTVGTNVVNGYNFNRNAYDQYNQDPREYIDNDMEWDEELDSDEEWTTIIKSQSLKKAPTEKCRVKSGPEKLQDVGLMLSQHAIATASQAAGVSFEYAQSALRYATLETAQGIGYLANSDMATSIIEKVKSRLPLLEDVKRAYQDGREVQRSRRLPPAPRQWKHDDLPGIMTDPETGAELHIVYEERDSSSEVKRQRRAPMAVAKTETGEQGWKRGVKVEDEVSPKDDGQLYYGGPLTYSGPIIGTSQDSEELKAAEDAEWTKKKEVNLRLKRAISKEF